MEKIKPRIKYWAESEKGKDIITVVIVILVGLGSFELGRLSKNSKNPGIRIEYPNQNFSQDSVQNVSQEASAISALKSADNFSQNTSQTSTVKNFFASNRGSKYYPVGCSAGKSLKQENRVYFATREEAERAGYELSGSCK